MYNGSILAFCREGTEKRLTKVKRANLEAFIQKLRLEFNMNEFVCQKCKARLGMFPKETHVKCTCGMEYDIDWNQNPPRVFLTDLRAEESEKLRPALTDRKEFSSSTEIEKFYQEVDRRKKKAIELGVPLLVMDVCLSKIRFSPAWSQIDSIPPEITDLKESKSADRDGITFKFGGSSYAYSYRNEITPDGRDSYVTKYEFRFSVDDNLVFECRGTCKHGYDESEKDLGITKSDLRKTGYCEVDSRWYKFTSENITAFIEAGWIDEIKRLAELIMAQKTKGEIIAREKKKAKQKQELENSAQIEDLKRRFGIS
jgi:hypothetical protein